MSIDTSRQPWNGARPGPRDAGRPAAPGDRHRPPGDTRSTEPASALAETPPLSSPTADWQASDDDLTLRLQSDSAPDPTIPVCIDRVLAGRYCLEREIGRGGFGVVLLAYDRELHRQVAIKVARRTGEPGVDLLLEEGRKVAQLDHANIVPVYDCGRIDDRTIFIVSKYIDGGSLSHRLALRRLPIEEAVAIARQIAEALAHAHERGLIHRDLKPSNILLDSKNDAYVADFGLALRATDRSDLICVEGSPQYMSPEQAGGKSRLVDRRTDVFSFGVILYEMITGRRPFPARSSAEYREQVIHEEPPAPAQLSPEIPPQLDLLCRKALAKNPAERHASAWELARELRQCRGCDQPRRPNRLPMLLGSSVLLLSAAVLILALLLWPRPSPPTTTTTRTADVATPSPDLEVAAWALDRGGAVDFEDVFPPTIRSPFALPTDPGPLLSLSLYGTAPPSADDLRKIPSCPELRHLHLGKTGLTDEGLDGFSRLSQLRVLILCHNDLTDEGLARLGPLEDLIHLDLEGTRLSDDGLDALGAARDLEFLNLSETGVGDAGIARLAHLDRLHELRLNRTKITDACVEDLLRLPGLRWLEARDTDLSDDAVARLEAGPSGCRVVR
jgi:serine/threonine protein kinase